MTGPRNTPVTQRIAELERFLGDPHDPHNPLGYTAVLEADEGGVPFAAGEHTLCCFGLNAEFVPRALGGRFDRADDLAGLMRSVFRRDGTLGVGYGVSSFVAGLPVWASGTPGQQRRAARILLAEGRLAGGFTELAHGNDLAGTSLRALPGDGGLVLDGGKQLIDNMVRAEAAVLFTRADDRPGGRGHTHLLVDLEKLPRDRAARDRRFRTSGLRGLLLGGIELRDCPVPADSVLGEPGEAMDTVLRAFQISHTVLPGMALGIADTQLRTVTGFVRERQLHAGPGGVPPLASATLVAAFTDLLACDALATVGARALHALPAETGVLSSAVMYLVPKILQDVSYRLSVLLGAQGLLRDGPYAIFQKAARDLPAVVAGQVGAAVCQASIVTQLPRLAQRSWLPALERAQRSGRAGPDDPLGTALSLHLPLPRLDFARLGLHAGGQDSPTDVLPAVHRELARGGWRDTGELAALTALFVEEMRELAASVARLSISNRTVLAGPRGFALADRYAQVLAGAACLGVWRAAQEAPEPGFVSDPAWVTAALHRLAKGLGLRPGPLPPPVLARLHAELADRYDRRRTLDLTAGPLA